MVRLTTLAGCAVLFAAFLVGTGRSGETKTQPKIRGRLPQYWSKLGLSTEQRQKVYAIQADYGQKIKALREQITKLIDQEKSARLAVLTDAQRKQLQAIISDRVGGGTEKAPEKKKTKKTSPESR